MSLKFRFDGQKIKATNWKKPGGSTVSIAEGKTFQYKRGVIPQ